MHERKEAEHLGVLVGSAGIKIRRDRSPCRAGSIPLEQRGP